MGNATYGTKNAVQSALNSLEPENPTFLTLNVLQQSTKSCKPGPTGRAWANIDFVLMGRAVKVLIQ